MRTAQGVAGRNGMPLNNRVFFSGTSRAHNNPELSARLACCSFGQVKSGESVKGPGVMQRGKI